MNKRNTFKFPSFDLPIEEPVSFKTDEGGTGDGGDSGTVDFDLQKVLSNEPSKKILVEWAEREIAHPLKAKNEEIFGKLVKYKIKTKDKDGKEVEVYLDPEEARVAVEEKRTGSSPEMQKEIDRAVKAANERTQVTIDSMRSENENLKERLAEEGRKRFNLLVDNSLRTALIDSGIKTAKLALHENFLKQFIGVTEEGGKEHVVIFDQNDRTKPRYGSSGLMSMSEFIAEYKSKEGIAEDWNATTKGGSGATITGPNGRIQTISQDLPPGERLKQFRRAQNRA